MLRIYLCIAIVLLTGCAHLYTESKSNEPHSKSLWTGVLLNDLQVGAHFIDISYLGEELATERYNKLGLDVTYYSPYDILESSNYPEAFILSRKKSNSVTILFVGTNSKYDWLQNTKSTNYEDKVIEGNYYIPPGHAGYRRGIMNLIIRGFFGNILDDHAKNHSVRDGSGQNIRIRLLGHSQGAGLAQLAAPIIDGYRYINGIRSKSRSSKYILEKLYAYGAPYTISTEGDDWTFMNNTYGGLSYMILKDGDLVASIYNSYKYERTVPSRHFGNYIRITRDNEVKREITSWGKDVEYGNEPHYIKGYRSALDSSKTKLSLPGVEVNKK